MSADVPSSETGVVDFRIQKTADGIVTSFSDLKKYLEFEFISEEDARGVLEGFRAFYGILVGAYQTGQVVDLEQAVYLRDTYNDLAAAYTYVAQFVPNETTRLVPINKVPDTVDTIKAGFEGVWASNDTGEPNPLLESR